MKHEKGSYKEETFSLCLQKWFFFPAICYLEYLNISRLCLLSPKYTTKWHFFFGTWCSFLNTRNCVHSLPPPTLSDIEMMPIEIEMLIALGVICTPSPEVPDQKNAFIAFALLYILITYYYMYWTCSLHLIEDQKDFNKCYEDEIFPLCLSTGTSQLLSRISR